jgi:hypothetical protein
MAFDSHIKGFLPLLAVISAFSYRRFSGITGIVGTEIQATAEFFRDNIRKVA